MIFVLLVLVREKVKKREIKPINFKALQQQKQSVENSKIATSYYRWQTLPFY